MDWAEVGRQTLQVAVWTLVPVALGFAANLARLWAGKVRNELWRQVALQVVSKVEAVARGRLHGEEKLALAMQELSKRGVPAERLHELIEWAVFELADRFDAAGIKREQKEAMENG